METWDYRAYTGGSFIKTPSNLSLSLTLKRRPQPPDLDYKKPVHRGPTDINTRSVIDNKCNNKKRRHLELQNNLVSGLKSYVQNDIKDVPLTQWEHFNYTKSWLLQMFTFQMKNQWNKRWRNYGVPLKLMTAFNCQSTGCVEITGSIRDPGNSKDGLYMSQVTKYI